MSLLPILDDQRQHKTGWRSTIATLLRCMIVALIALAVRISSHAERQSAVAVGQTFAVDQQLIDQDLPGVAVIEHASPDGLCSLKNATNQVIGFAVSTLPAAADIVGYRGPSNVLLVFNESSEVVGASLLESEDTPEHVAAIVNDGEFFEQFDGWTLGAPHTFSDIDAVSGATLTSLAIAEGILLRLGSEKPSLRFPDNLNQSDLELFWGTHTTHALRTISNVEADVVSSNSTLLGSLIRTGPLIDSIAGYQGPSEILLFVDANGKTNHLALRTTFDNQPYAGYLNEEPYFWKAFQGKTINELAKLNLEDARVEGVSGATMTSIAVAETIVAAAENYHKQQLSAQQLVKPQTIHWRVNDVGTALVLLIGIAIGLTRLRSVAWLKKLWNVVLVTYLGLLTGSLISLAVLFGWAAQGIAWRLAPGLAAVIAISFLLSATTKRNIYCSHVCPHGAAQQLLKRLRPGKHVPKWIRHLLWLPGATLILAVIVTILNVNCNLAAWEPFNAYIWYVAGIGSLVLAVGSLLVSAFIPMAYCRYGCATGRLLNYVRHSAKADRFTFADGVAAALCLLAWSRLVS